MNYLSIFVPFLILISSCAQTGEKLPVENPVTVMEPAETEDDADSVMVEMEDLADSVMLLLRKKDYLQFKKIIHPKKEVRLSPYPYIQKDEDIWLHGIHEWVPTDRTMVLWGHYDGSGEPMYLTIDEYMDQFVTDADYLGKGEKLVNSTKSKGNSVDNMKEVYPGSEFVEYYIPGTKKNEFMDWKSLRLVFEKKNGEWKLVGIIHGQWTI